MRSTDRSGFTPVVTVAVFALFLLMGVMVASMGAALPRLRARFHDPAGLDTLVSWYSLGALATIIATGALRRWVPPRRLIVIGQVVLAIGYAGMALAPSWYAFLAAAVVAGLGAGVLLLYLNTAVARGFGANAVVAVNIINAGFGIGAVLGPVIIGGSGQSGIRFVAAAAAALTMLSWAAPRAGLVLRQPRQPATSPRPSTSPGSAQVALIIGVGFLYAGMEMSIGTWETTYLTWSGFNASTAAWCVAAFWGGLATGRIILPPLAVRLAPHRAIQVYLVVTAIALATATLPIAAPVAFIVVGLTFAPILPTTIAWLSQTSNRPETANSWLFTATMLGNVLIPALVAMIARPSWPPAVPLTIAGGCLLCLIVAGAAGRAGHVDPPDHRAAPSAGQIGRARQESGGRTRRGQGARYGES
jgi:fucose permease